MLRKISDLLAKTRKDEKGFTLIELLVVILIIGILAAIALPSFLGQASKGADATAKSNLRAAVTKVEACGAEAADGLYGTCMSNLPGAGTPYAVTGNATGTTSQTAGYTLTVQQGSGSKASKVWSVQATGGNVGNIQ